jgi:hypothetical protein
VALAETGAAVGQYIDLVPGSLRLEPDERTSVLLGGGRGVVQRRVTLHEWVTPMLDQAVESANEGQHRLCLITPTQSRTRDVRNVTATLDRALAVAGIAGTALSIRLAIAQTQYAVGGAAAACDALGVTTTSLVEDHIIGRAR